MAISSEVPPPVADSASPKNKRAPLDLRGKVYPWFELLLAFGGRLLWALLTLFVIAFVTFAGSEMAQGTE